MVGPAGSVTGIHRAHNLSVVIFEKEEEESARASHKSRYPPRVRGLCPHSSLARLGTRRRRRRKAWHGQTTYPHTTHTHTPPHNITHLLLYTTPRYTTANSSSHHKHTQNNTNTPTTCTYIHNTRTSPLVLPPRTALATHTDEHYLRPTRHR
jgi:hypothetical protein